MKRVLTSMQMQRTDQYTIQAMKMPAMVLMEKAAEAVYHRLLTGSADLRRVLVVCGSGNNGADGMAVARMLTQHGIDAGLYLAGNPTHFSTEAALQWEIAENYHTKVVNNPQWPEYTTIVDALFGTGLSRDVTGIYAECIEHINLSGAYVLSVDIPSGINGTTGRICGCAVRADETVTFAFYKPGQLLFPGAAYAGEVLLADVGIYESGEGYGENLFLPETADLALLQGRKKDGNKGTFGKILFIAGSEDIYGAAYMGASAALRCGVGMVKVITAKNQIPKLNMALPEAMTASYDGENFAEVLDEGVRWADFVGIGPGLGTGRRAKEILEHIVKNVDKPLVIDADGLNLLAQMPGLLAAHKGPVILTPHMGEMSRLSGKTMKELKEDPIAAARDFARTYQSIVVMKDARTITAFPDGTAYINRYGNSGMATAGSGDVLTGTILGCLGAGKTPEESAWLGVLLHACAGDLAAEEKGEASLMAMDICRQLNKIGDDTI